MKKRSGIIALTLALSFALAGCSGGQEKSAEQGGQEPLENVSEEPPAAGSVSDEGSKDSLTIVIPTDVGMFSPHYTMTHADIYLGFQLYDRLVHYVDGQWKGQLAESWDISDDLMTLTFYLREGATFHSGTPITANDVKYSFELNLERPSMLANRSKITDIIAQDDHTVVIKLSYPMESALHLLAGPYFGVINQAYCEEKGDDAFIEPDGSGAYQLKNWNKGSLIELEAYENYAGDKANIRYLNFEIIPDENTAVIALEKGTVDMIINMSAANVDLLSTNPDIDMTYGPSHTSSKLFMNVRGGVTANKALRQAVAHAINREAINTVAYEGRGQISSGMFDDFMFYSGLDFSYEYDVDRALALMDESGLSNVQLTIKTSEYYGSTIPTLIQQDLAKIGINLTIDSLEMNAHSADYNSGNYELWFTANSSILPDVSELMYSNYHYPESTFFFAPGEDFINDLLDEAKMETDSGKKTDMYDTILMEVKDNAGQIDLVNAESNLVYRKGLKNIYLDPNGMLYCYQYFSW